MFSYKLKTNISKIQLERASTNEKKSNPYPLAVWDRDPEATVEESVSPVDLVDYSLSC